MKIKSNGALTIIRKKRGHSITQVGLMRRNNLRKAISNSKNVIVTEDIKR